MMFFSERDLWCVRACMRACILCGRVSVCGQVDMCVCVLCACGGSRGVEKKGRGGMAVYLVLGTCIMSGYGVGPYMYGS